MVSERVAIVSALNWFDANDPNAYFRLEPSVGVLTLASILRREYPLRFVDLNDGWRRSGNCSGRFIQTVAAEIAQWNPAIVGLGSICSSFPVTVRIAEAIRRALPQSFLVIGGPHASVVDVELLKTFPFIDAVVRGEAEDTFPKVVAHVLGRMVLEGIPGVTYRSSGRIQRNIAAPVILDLDRVPLPAFDLHPGIEKLTNLPLEIGRGCPFACRFCSTNDFFRRTFRLKSPDCVIEQMRILQSRYGVSMFDLTHDMFTVQRRKVVAFCDAVRSSGLRVYWSCSARTDSVDPELLQIMHQAGCRGIFFGIETGSQRLQRVIGKNLDLEAAKSVVKCCDAHGMQTTTSLISGYPDETEQDLADTVRFIVDMAPLRSVDPQFHVLSPLPETPLTTENYDQLYLPPGWTEISENGTEQSVEDEELIRQYPAIFSNFYAFPTPLDLEQLRVVRDVLRWTISRCRPLVEALQLAVPDFLELIRRWLRQNAGLTSAYYASWRFICDFLNFIETEFADSTVVLIIARFCRALAQDDEAFLNSGNSEPGQLTLGPHVHLIEVHGDVIAAIDVMRTGTEAPPELLARRVTLTVRTEPGRDSQIEEFSSLVNLVLRHAKIRSTPEEMTDDFELRNASVAGCTAAQASQELAYELSARGYIRLPLEASEPRGWSAAANA